MGAPTFDGIQMAGTTLIGRRTSDGATVLWDGATDTWKTLAELAGGGGGGVTTVFGRSGDVVQVLNDYPASMVFNDSGASGASVADVLNDFEGRIQALEMAPPPP